MQLQIEDDIDASMQYIDSVRRKPRHFQEGLAARTSRLARKIDEATLSASEAAGIVNTLRSAAWPVPQQDELIERVHAKMMSFSEPGDHEAATDPRKQQDFTSLSNFLTDNVLHGDNRDHELYLLVASLGLCRTKEKSMGTMTAIRLALDIGLDLLGLVHHLLHHALMNIKELSQGTFGGLRPGSPGYQVATVQHPGFLLRRQEVRPLQTQEAVLACSSPEASPRWFRWSWCSRSESADPYSK